MSPRAGFAEVKAIFITPTTTLVASASLYDIVRCPKRRDQIERGLPGKISQQSTGPRPAWRSHLIADHGLICHHTAAIAIRARCSSVSRVIKTSGSIPRQVRPPES